MEEFILIKLSPVGKPIYNNEEVELRVVGGDIIIIIIYYIIITF